MVFSVPARVSSKPMFNVAFIEEDFLDNPFENVHTYWQRGSRSFMAKLNTAALDTISASRRTQTSEQPKVKTVGKCKEVDSGIPSLETVYSAPGDSSASSPPLSVASAPASLGTRDDINLNTSSADTTLSDSPTFTNDLLSAKDPWSIPPFNDVHLHMIERYFEMFQGTYPAEYCIFVGNLPASCTDYQLAIAVKVLFEQYGTCEVMINRRYSPNHVKPFAYVQFLRNEPALAALAHNGHQVIGGRVLRTSPSSAKRSVIFVASNQQNLLWALDLLECIGGPIEEAEWWGYDVVEVKFLHHGSYAQVKRLVRGGYQSPLGTIQV